MTSANIMPAMSEGRYEDALDMILSVMEMKGKTARYLLEKEAWDVFMVLFGESDLVGHHFWRFTDPRSPLFTETRSAKVREAIYLVYAKLDEMLPTAACDACPARQRAADRFRPRLRRIGRPGHLHEQVALRRGVPEVQERPAGRRSDDEGGPRRPSTGACASLPPAIKTHIFRKRTEIANKMESYLRFGGIDWSGTTAFSEELPYLQTIWINVKGREPEGIVEPGAEYDSPDGPSSRAADEAGRTRSRVSRSSTRCCTGIRSTTGPHKERSPDLVIVRTRYPDGYAYQGKSTRQSSPPAAIERIDPGSPGADAFYSSKSGTHRDMGIFIAQGPMIPAGSVIEGARLMDIAPTLLYLLGEPIPNDMDGRALTRALDPAFVEGRETVSGPATSQTAGSEDATYSTEDEAEISKRLQELGYLE